VKTVLFFDLDGVLADFVGGALAAHGRGDVPASSVPWCIEKALGIEPTAFWAPLGFDFWANLKPLPDGMRLFDRACVLMGADRIGLLTSPCETHGCADGKRAWVKRHLPPAMSRRLFIGSAKELFAGPHKVLVDDHDANIDRFHEAGGATVQPPRPWNRHKALCVRGHEFDADIIGEMLTETVCRTEGVR
jgi:hypothetical protein